jgi:1-acyl-sn-glycerol-3-phosphate acyltransferase
MRGMRAVYSCLFWAFLAVSSIAMFPIAVVVWAVTALFDRRRYLLHRVTCFWGSLYTWFNPAWPVTVTGREKLDEDEPCVIVSNHLSLLDILVLFRLFSHFKWVSKIENFRIPFIGWNMSLNRYIELRRGDRRSVVQMMRDCEATIAEGNSVMMFPEGTRSPSGRMRSFKTGAFELALKTRSPIQPLVLKGTADALPKRGFLLQGRHPITINVLDRIPYETFESLSADELTAHVRGIIAAYLEDHLDEEADAKKLEPTGSAARS